MGPGKSLGEIGGRKQMLFGLTLVVEIVRYSRYSLNLMVALDVEPSFSSDEGVRFVLLCSHSQQLGAVALPLPASSAAAADAAAITTTDMLQSTM